MAARSNVIRRYVFEDSAATEGAALLEMLRGVDALEADASPAARSPNFTVPSRCVFFVRSMLRGRVPEHPVEVSTSTEP